MQGGPSCIKSSTIAQVQFHSIEAEDEFYYTRYDLITTNGCFEPTVSRNFSEDTIFDCLQATYDASKTFYFLQLSTSS